MKNKIYIDYEQYLRTEQNILNLKNKGVQFLFKKNKFKICLGVSALIIAIIPNGLGLVCYPLGFMLLGITKADLYNYKEKGLRICKNKIRWCLK